MALFYFKHMFIGCSDAPAADAVECDDDDYEDDGASSSSTTQGEVPNLLQPKLFNIINHINGVFNMD